MNGWRMLSIKIYSSANAQTHILANTTFRVRTDEDFLCHSRVPSPYVLLCILYLMYACNLVIDVKLIVEKDG
jgi:hypothetical protein